MLALLWSVFVVFGYYQLWDTNGLEAVGLNKDIRNGVLVITGLLLLTFSGHWLWKARSVASASAMPTVSASAQASSALAGEGKSTFPANTKQSMLAGDDERFVLEVRGLGLAVGDY
ncbi:hypothetical protein V2I52_16865 [Brenneria sp. g21c3]|uniref:hypothetical protein n=1 Tax=Brenneria sp. g21c3 TaxID=3093893 RepID=UPI002EB980FC|nr:hypothetical protein [Brenneria sp. g21c3]